jgi:hypothetical protein
MRGVCRGLAEVKGGDARCVATGLGARVIPLPDFDWTKEE